MVSSDVQYAIKMVSLRMGVTQRLLTDLLLLQGIVPYLEKLGEKEELWQEGAHDLKEHFQLIQRRLRKAIRKEVQNDQEDDDS